MKLCLMYRARNRWLKERLRVNKVDDHFSLPMIFNLEFTLPRVERDFIGRMFWIDASRIDQQNVEKS